MEISQLNKWELSSVKMKKWTFFSLPTTGLIFGWLDILSGLFLITICLVEIIHDQRMLDVLPNYTRERALMDLFKLKLMGFAYVLEVIIGGLLVVAVHNKRYKLTLPWLIVHALCYVIMFPFLIYLTISTCIQQFDFASTILAFVLLAAVIGFLCYNWIAIYILHCEMKNSNENQPKILNLGTTYNTQFV